MGFVVVAIATIFYALEEQELLVSRGVGERDAQWQEGVTMEVGLRMVPPAADRHVWSFVISALRPGNETGRGAEDGSLPFFAAM